MSKIRTALNVITSGKKIIRPLGDNGLLNWMPDEIYLKLLYKSETGLKLHLDEPKSFSEKLQWLKLHDRRQEFVTLVDKYAVKDHVGKIIGKQYIIPTLGVWDNAEDIDFDRLPDQFVLKCNHDSGGIVICKSKSELNEKAAVKKLTTHLKRNPYCFGREWPYKMVQRKIIAEQFLEDETKDLTDYKFYCFNGVPTYCQVIKDRRTRESIDFYDMDWKLQPFTGFHTPGKPFPHGTPTKKPERLSEMIGIAEKLSIGVPFSRIDLYYVNKSVYFGEFTLFPKSGLGVFEPDEWNYTLGKMLDISINSENVQKMNK